MNRRAFLTATGLGAVSTSAGCLQIGTTDEETTPTPGRFPKSATLTGWPQLRANEAHTAQPVGTSGPDSFPLKPQWSVDDSGVVTTPVAAGDAVFAGLRDGTVLAVEAASGTQVWDYDAGSEVTGEPVAVEGTVYVGTHDGTVVALDAYSGQERWSFTSDAGIHEAGDMAAVAFTSAIGDERVYVAFRKGQTRLYAVDHDNGTQVWARKTEVEPAAPVLAGGTLYVSGNAYDPSSGDVRWRGPFDAADIALAPAVTESIVCFTTPGGKVVAIAPDSGKTRWQRSFDRRFARSPVIAGDRVYIPGQALELSTGKTAWQLDVETHTSPSVDGGVGYVAAGRRLLAIDLETGDKTWEHAFDARITHAPAIADGRLYIGAQGGLYAFG